MFIFSRFRLKSVHLQASRGDWVYSFSLTHPLEPEIRLASGSVTVVRDSASLPASSNFSVISVRSANDSVNTVRQPT